MIELKSPHAKVGLSAFRAALLASAAAAALCLAPARSAHAGPDQFTRNSGTRIWTCTGNQSQGVSFGKVIVRNLNGDIAPPPGTIGVRAYILDSAYANIQLGSYSIVTSGDDTPGVYAYGQTGLQVIVTTSGDIETSGARSDAIDVNPTFVDAIVSTTGDLVTTGDDSDGISVIGIGGPNGISVVSRGDITTAGDRASAIRIAPNPALPGPSNQVLIDSIGDLSTAGSGSPAITVDMDGPVTIASTGLISTTGDNADAIGIKARSADVASAGPITTSGLGAYAFRIAASEAVVVSNNGLVTTAGDFAVGIGAHSYQGQVTLSSVGDIVTAGVFSDSIFANASAGAAVVHNAGAITTSGDDSHAIFASGRTGAEVGSAGLLSTSGARSDAILAASQGGNVEVSSAAAGAITTSGDEAYGIRAVAYAGQVVVRNDAVATTSAIPRSASAPAPIKARSRSTIPAAWSPADRCRMPSVPPLSRMMSTSPTVARSPPPAISRAVSR